MARYHKSYFESTKSDAESMKRYLLTHGKKKVIIRRGLSGNESSKYRQKGYRVWSLDKK